jgi:hypothetical protein
MSGVRSYLASQSEEQVFVAARTKAIAQALV